MRRALRLAGVFRADDDDHPAIFGAARVAAEGDCACAWVGAIGSVMIARLTNKRGKMCILPPCNQGKL